MKRTLFLSRCVSWLRVASLGIGLSSVALAHPGHHHGHSHDKNATAAAPQAVEADLGTVQLDLPDDLPAEMEVAFRYDGEEWRLQLWKSDVFGPNTKLLIDDGSGELKPAELGLDRSYLGAVAGKPGLDVSAVLSTKGLHATILRSGDSAIGIEPLGDGAHKIKLMSQGNSTKETVDELPEVAAFENEGFVEGGEETPEVPVFALQAGQTSNATLPPTRVMDVLEYEIGVEISSRAFLNNYNADMSLAQSVAQSVPTSLNARFLRAAGVQFRLGTLIIRTDAATDPINVANGNDTAGLNAFRDYWNSNSAEVGNTHDLAVYHVNGAPSGLAYVNAIGTSNRYLLGANTSPDTWVGFLLNHEVGHQWNLRHRGDAPITDYDYTANGPLPDRFYEALPRNNNGMNSAGGNHIFLSIMVGSGTNNKSRLSTEEALTVIQTKENKRSLGDAVTNIGPVSPFGHMDVVQAVAGTPLVIDVIANDYDVNNDVLEAHLLDTVSQRGGTITLSAGTGPGGRNELIYTAPANLTGVDFFHYTVCDSTGRTDFGAVYVETIGPTTVDLARAGYYYDLGPSDSVLFDQNLDPYERLSNVTFGDVGFTSNGPNPIEVRDRGTSTGANAINRDHIRMRSPGTFVHKLANGFYNVLLTIGDATEGTAPIRLTAEGTTTLTTNSQTANTFSSYVLQGVEITDGELNLNIENLGFTANISRIIITRTGIRIDPNARTYVYDVQSANGNVQAGATALTNLFTLGDVRWSGGGVNATRYFGSNDFNADFAFSSGTRTLSHPVANGQWQVTLNMGDSEILRDDMQVRAEGQLISADIDSPAGQFAYVDANGGSATPTSFTVDVTDGELNLEFSDNGGTDPEWALTRIVLAQGDGDIDGDTFSDFLETAIGTDPNDINSRPGLSSDSLVAHYRLDETSGGIAADSTANGQNATWAGTSGENTWVTGLIGNAAQTNDEDGGSGQEHFRTADLSALNGATQFSVSMWFRQDVGSNNNSTYNGLFMTRNMTTTAGSGAGENWGFALENSATPRHIDWRVNGAAGPETDNLIGQTSTTWEHVIFAWDGDSGTARLYQNGQLISTQSAPTGSIINGGEWRIGDDACCNSREFTGTMDDIAVFRSALDANDAAQIYAAGNGGFAIDRLLPVNLSPATIITGNSTGISDFGSNFLYTISDVGIADPDVTVYYGTSNGGTDPASWDSSSALGTRAAGTHFGAMTGLLRGTQYYYTVAATNPGGTAFGSIRNFTTTQPNYSRWATQNSVIGLAAHDDDSDGISNLLEYALGLDPQVRNDVGTALVGNIVTYNKGLEAVSNGDIVYSIETSTTLADPWTPVTPTIDTDEIISYTIPNGGTRLFVRLRVVQQ